MCCVHNKVMADGAAALMLMLMLLPCRAAATLW